MFLSPRFQLVEPTLDLTHPQAEQTVHGADAFPAIIRAAGLDYPAPVLVAPANAQALVTQQPGELGRVVGEQPSLTHGLAQLWQTLSRCPLHALYVAGAVWRLGQRVRVEAICLQLCGHVAQALSP